MTRIKRKMESTPRILVVDDEVDTLGLIGLTLETAGYEVETTVSGTEALRLLKQEHFDLALMDIMMPDMSGFDVIRAMHRESSGMPPFIFLTAKNLPEDRERGLSLGAEDFIVKPATRGQLLDAIEKALNAR